MFQLNSLTLTDCAVWRAAQFTFEEGITDVRGRNRSGKSVLFSPLPACLFGVPLPKRGYSTIDFNRDDRNIQITAKSNGKNNHYDIVIDGKNQHVETIADGRAVIDRLLPIPDSLFYTTVHISGLNKHPLAASKPAERLEWIQQTLADSLVYESYSSLVAKELSDLKADVGKAELLKGQLADLTEPKVPDDKYSPKMVRKIKDKIAEIGKELEALSSEIDEIKQYTSIGELVEFDADKYKKVQRKFEDMAELREKYNYAKLHEKQRAKAEKILTDIKVTCAFVGAPAKPKKILKKIDSMIEKAEKKVERIKKHRRLWEDQAEIRADREIKVEFYDKKPNVDTIEEKIEKLKDQRRDLQRHEELLSSGKSVCPTCGTEINKKGQKSKQTVEGVTKLIKNYEMQKRKLIALEADLVEKPEGKLDVEENYLSNLETLKDLCEKYVNLDVEDTEEVDFDIDKFNALKEQLAELDEVKAQYKLQRKQLENVSETVLKLKNPRKVLKEKNETYSSLNSRLQKLNERLSAYVLYEQLKNQYDSQKEKFDTSLSELGNIEQKQKVLKALKDAFSRDGLLAMRLDKVTTTFVDQLNACAPLIWNEPFKFELDIGPRRCDVIAHRNKQASTISTFSGSEQRGWQLVSALALLRILPSDKRFDTIILDELEANMDEASQERFIQDYLPELRKVVPKIVVVSPLSRKILSIPADRSFDVVKRKSISTLEPA